MKKTNILLILGIVGIGAFIYFKKRKEKTASSEAKELPSTTETSSTTSTQAEQKIKVEYRDKDGARHTQNATKALLDSWVLLSVNNNGKGSYTIVNARRPGLIKRVYEWMIMPTNQSATSLKVGVFDGQQFQPKYATSSSMVEPAAKEYADWAIVYNKNTKDIYLVEPAAARAVGLIK